MDIQKGKRMRRMQRKQRRPSNHLLWRVPRSSSERALKYVKRKIPKTVFMCASAFFPKRKTTKKSIVCTYFRRITYIFGREIYTKTSQMVSTTINSRKNCKLHEVIIQKATIVACLSLQRLSKQLLL